MRKYKLKLNKSRKHNSGKTWETPTYLFLENIEYDVDVENQNIYIVFDFVKYEIKFNIDDKKLYTSFLNQLYYVFSTLKYNDDLKNTVEELEKLSNKNLFDFDIKEFPKDDGTIGKKTIITLNIEYGKKLADIKSNLNKLLYQMPIYFCYHYLEYTRFKKHGLCEVFAVDKPNIVEAVRNSGWNKHLYLNTAIEKLNDFNKKLEHWKSEYEQRKSWFCENKVEFYTNLIAETEAKIKEIGG